MEAYDSADTSRRATADVTIDVTRNPSGPNFINDPYQVTIPQNYPLGDTVINATAIDQDGVWHQFYFLYTPTHDEFLHLVWLR